jgi:hypothetical protein
MKTTRDTTAGVEITQRHFDVLRERFGSHSEAARYLGIEPSYYRYIRRNKVMSKGLARLIQLVAESS